MLIMYNAQPNSPNTTLNGSIDNSTTSITVVDASLLPSPPMLLTISYDTLTPETILMTNKVGNVLTVVRGVDGISQSHLNSAKIARLFTAKDLNDVQSNILEISNKSIMVSFDFGSNPEETYIETVVTGLSWVKSNSNIVATLYGEDIGERSSEDGILEGIILSVKNIVVGVGFTLSAYAPHGANGAYKAMCIAIIN